MDAFKIIKKLSTDSGVTMKEIASSMGISPQACYKSLHGRISLDSFQKMVEACGYSLVILDKNNKIATRIK